MALTLALLFGFGPPAASAQTVPAASSVGHVVEPNGAAPASVSVGAGYGYTEAVLGDGDTHHRLTGALAGSARLAPWLRAGLRLDGRYDAHAGDTAGSDDGWVGDPRLFVQADRAIGAVRVGARLGLWLPGASAPSVVADAASLELVGLAAWTARGGRLTLSAHAGFRIDRSGASAPDGMLAPGDRLALGVSDFDALLLGAGAGVRVGRAVILAHASADLLVGEGAPPASESPLRVGAGVRFGVTPSVDLEAMTTISPGARPEATTGAPLVPVEPRLSIALGATIRFGGGARPVGGTPSPPLPAALHGAVTALGAPLGGVSVEIVPASGPAVQLVTDDRGAFRQEGLAPGWAVVRAAPPGFRPGEAHVELVAGSSTDVTLALAPDLPPGQIRGVVRSFSGEPIRAKIAIEPLGATVYSSATDGTFQIDVPPGAYEVVVAQAGYETQRRKIRVDENGVTLINMDLRRRP